MEVKYLVRPAKPSWNDPTLPDPEQPLAAPGRCYTAAIGKRLAKHDAKPDLLLSSPAVRALATAEAIAAHVMQVSPNTELTDHAHRLSGEITLLPTCAVAAFRFDAVMAGRRNDVARPVALDDPRRPQGRPNRGRGGARTPRPRQLPFASQEGLARPPPPA